MRNNIDSLYISRLSSLPIRYIQNQLKKCDTKIFFDLDDPIFLSKPSFPIIIKNSLFQNIESIVKNSYSVIVSSNYLYQYVKNFNANVFHIHTPIDTRIFRPLNKKRHDKVFIGWQGVPANHLVNLKIIRDVLKQLGKKYDIKFNIVSYLGDQRVKKIFRSIEDYVEVDYGLDYLVPFPEISTLISDFDIYLAPLINSHWYQGKSAIRVGIGMAMGIPVVASPVGEQKYVVRHRINGFLARTQEEWYRYIGMLIEDDGLRREIGMAGRETAETELSLAVCGKKLLKILTKVV